MPLITVSMYPGRTQEQKEEYAKAITKSAVEILKTKESLVIVVFEDNTKENWFLAGNQLYFSSSSNFIFLSSSIYSIS